MGTGEGEVTPFEAFDENSTENPDDVQKADESQQLTDSQPEEGVEVSEVKAL
ncbi:MAG: hypothetical protein J6K39_03815 [Clostridia bacterium]|nr:hypothetical protein [Clostridia bacterium]